ncbi:MAG: serine hydrolase [Candidatus Hydrogenedentota bacterium]|nr:MAG: serine hydrolase [Candidatus Hydrogenedentota bacterium]
MSNIRILRIFILTLVITGIAAPTFAQGLPQTTPEEVGLSQERLDRIDKAIREDVENNELRGALAMVARKGKLAYITYHGMADTEKDIPMAEDTIFRIYSMTKPITSVAVMMLFEEGHFFLDDPVSKFIPELGGLRVIDEDAENPGGGVFNLPDEIEEVSKARKVKVIPANTVPSNRDMTIRDLLRHTSGLTYGFFGNTKVDQMYQQNGVLITDMNLEDMVRKLGNFPLLFQPGEQWHYSLSVDVLGRLVEVVSGQSFDEFLQDRIFAPLDMVDTGFYVPKEKMNRFANLYAPAKDGEGIVPANPMMSFNFIAKPRLFSGGGGLVSTGADYLRFCQMMLNGGQLDGERLLSRKTVELMTVNHCLDADLPMAKSGYGFGLGFAVAENRGRSASLATEGEYNWGGAAGTRFWIDPEEEFIGIYMVQILPHIYTFGSEFKQLAYQAISD